MDVTLATLSDVGRVRTNNEDSFFADPDLGLFVVCDGMGGHSAGEVASKMACEVLAREVEGAAKLRERFLSTGSPADAKALRKAVEAAVTAAGKEIYKRAARTPEMSGMGTTCTMVLLAGHHKAILGHVGDSRLFVSRNGELHQLSEDHTYVNELMKRGAITREQAKSHPQGNVLSRALGVQQTVAADTMIFDLDPGDTFLLCSDGLYNYYPQPGELTTALASPDLSGALEGLIKTAKDRGGHDNLTGVAFRIGGEAAEQGLSAEARIAVLRRIPIFSHLHYGEAVKVLGLTQLVQAAGGMTLCKEGEPGQELYVVLSGEVCVQRGGQTLAVLQPGAHVGEMAMVDSAPRSASVVARTDANLLVMRRDEFFGLIRQEPVIATKLLWSFVQVLSGRLRDTNQQLQGQKREQGAPEEFEIFVDEGE